MKPSWSFTRGLLLGAGLMYLLDPSEGVRRRALVRDKGTRAWRRSSRYLTRTGRDLRNRARGRAALAIARLRSGNAPDWVIEEQVRSRLGHVVSHPHAVTVESVGGCVMLSGPILRVETHPLIEAVQSIEGVVDVENRLEEHESGEHVPALQGGVPRRGESSRLGFFSAWPRPLQILATAAGAVAVVYGAKRAIDRIEKDGDEDEDEERLAPNYAYLR